MIVGIDKNTLDAPKNKKYDYIYLYDDEKLEDLLETGLHCIQYKHCKYVDINLTDYDIDCIKKCKITDKDWDNLEYKLIILKNYFLIHFFLYFHLLLKSYLN